MNVLLDLDEEKFYKRIIRSNSSIEFIVMNDNEIKTYEESIQSKHKEVEQS
jgi:hypothetical protein